VRAAYNGRDQPSPFDDNDEPLVSSSTEALRSWVLTCSDCGTNWEVLPGDIIAGNGWLACPNCVAAKSRISLRSSD